MLAPTGARRCLAIMYVLALGGCSSVEMQGKLETGSITSPSDQRPYEEFLNAGRKDFARGDYGLAEQNFRATVESNPVSLTGWIGLAASYDRLRRFDLADRAYEQALKLGGRTAQYLNNRGYHYLLKGDRKRAAEYLNAAAQMEPGNTQIQGNIRLAETWSKSDE